MNKLSLSKSRVIILIVFFSSVVFFILGLTFPILSTKKQVLGLVLNYQEVKLFDTVEMFYESREYFLGTIIFLFTMVLPILKYGEIFLRIFPLLKFSEKTSFFLHQLDKWSMIDVFLIALIILNVKMNSNILVMKVQDGALFLAISIILRMLTTVFIDYRKGMAGH